MIFCKTVFGTDKLTNLVVGRFRYLWRHKFWPNFDVRQISVGDLAAMAERWNMEHGANFYFLIFSASWGRIEKNDVLGP